MISTGIFIALMAGVGGALVFTVWDNDNRLFGNIITAFLGSVFSFYLAASISGGNVKDYAAGEIVQDAALSYLFVATGLILGILVLALSAEALMMYRADQRRALWGEE